MFLPVCADYFKNDQGKTEIGPETEIACDEVISLARMEVACKNEFKVVATAGRPGKEFGKDPVALAMKEYMYFQYRGMDVKVSPAKRFHTSGEIKEFARIIRDITAHELNVEPVIVVKWWHAPRARWLCQYWFDIYKVRIPFTVVECHSRVTGIRAQLAYFAHTYIGIPYNKLRITIFGH